MLTDETGKRLCIIMARWLEALERAEAREVIGLPDFLLEEAIDLSAQTVFGYIRQYGLPWRGGPHAKNVKISRACGRRLLALVPSLKAQSTGEEPRR